MPPIIPDHDLMLGATVEQMCSVVALARLGFTQLLYRLPNPLRHRMYESRPLQNVNREKILTRHPFGTDYTRLAIDPLSLKIGL